MNMESKFSLTDKEIRDINGNTYRVKRLTLRKEIEIFKILSKFTQESGEGFPTSLDTIPEMYAKIASIMLEVPYESVLDNFDLFTLKDLVDPFLEVYAKELLVKQVPQVDQTKTSTEESVN